MFEISDGKLAAVITEVQGFGATDDRTADEITDFVLTDGPAGQEHQDWLNSAPTSEIASWVIAGLK